MANVPQCCLFWASLEIKDEGAKEWTHRNDPSMVFHTLFESEPVFIMSKPLAKLWKEPMRII
jgi:hypothetical protein